MSDQFAAAFRRRPNDGWFRAGNFDVTTTDILCGLSIVSMFLWGLFRDAWDRLWFAPVLVRDFELWRLVTWPVAAEPAIWPLLGIVFFYLFGQQLEALFGRGKFLAWVLALTIVPALILTMLGPLSDSIDFMIAYGLNNLFLGGIWVYAATYPGVKWFEVIPLWALAAIFTVLNFLQFTGTDQTGQVIFLLGYHENPKDQKFDPTGSQTILSVSLDDHRLTILVPRFERRAEGGRLWLECPREHVRFFDPASGRRLALASLSPADAA